MRKSSWGSKGEAFAHPNDNSSSCMGFFNEREWEGSGGKGKGCLLHFWLYLRLSKVVGWVPHSLSSTNGDMGREPGLVFLFIFIL